MVRLNGANYIKFSKISIVATNASLGYGVVLTNGASYNEFSNCVIQVPAGTASTTSTRLRASERALVGRWAR